MRFPLAILLTLSLPCLGATHYVSTNGTDSGTATSWGAAWRTLAYAEAHAVNGDTIEIGQGDYEEYVYISGVTNLTWSSSSNATTAAFRVGSPSNTFTGLRLRGAQNAGGAWGAYFRIEPAGHYTTITNCYVGDAPQVIATNFTFNPTNDTIYSPSVDFVSAGFKTNGVIYWGGISLTNWNYANMCNSGTIVGVASNTLTIADGAITENETNKSAWSYIFPGTGYGGIKGFDFIVSGGNGPGNCRIVNNTFTNIPASGCWNICGNTNLIMGNFMVRQLGGSGVHIKGSGNQIISNRFQDCILPVYYSSYELNNLIYHPAGGGFYDFVGGFMHTDAYSVSGNSNNLVAFNWFEHVEQPSWNFGAFGKGDEYRNWQIVSNVFVGVMNGASGSLNDMTIAHNTFFRCAFNEDVRYTLALGSTVTTNLTVTNNLFLDCGDHASLGAEGGFSIVNTYGTITTNGNVILGPEVAGSPIRVRNADNPKGADGIPFTADDGLRPIPGSNLSGVGALPNASGLVPHFRPVMAAWNESTGSNYSPAWQALAPFQRTTLMRPYTAPPTLGKVPFAMTFQATNSASGTFSTTNWPGITDYLWDFGDGSRPIWTRWPDVTHTFLVTGAVTMTLTVTNTAGATATTTRRFNVVPLTTFNRHVYYVSTNGSDSSGDGTWATPWRTITNGTGRAVYGDYVAILPGQYDEWIDSSSCGAETGYATNVITMVGYNAQTRGVRQEYSWWTWEGFEFTGTNVGASCQGAFHSTPANSGITVRNCWIHDGADNVMAFYVEPTSGANGTNYVFRNNLIQRQIGGAYGACFSITRKTNVVVDANIAQDTLEQGDFIQCNSWDVTISRNYCRDIGGDNHPDFFQVVYSAGVPVGNLVIERNWVEITPANTNVVQIGQSATSEVWGQDNTNGYFTNVVFRNNVFIGTHNGQGIHLDGVKFLNNLFFRCASAVGNTVTAGGANGTAWGLGLTNNVFFECGPTRGQSAASGWYENGCSFTNISVFADYNFVCGSNYVAKHAYHGTVDAFHWSIPGQETHGINGGNPYFADQENHDFRLQTNSPLLLVGASNVVTSDYWGFTRPTVPSLGPFESGVYVTPTTNYPSTNSVLRIMRATSLRIGRIKVN